MFKFIAFVLLALVLAGCASWRFGPYVSPQVTGRVLAADTREPVTGVTVSRGRGEQPLEWPPKGAELLMRKAPTRTDRDGRFELASEQILALISWGGWSTVRLTFQCAGYERFRTNYSARAPSFSQAGEPLVNVGDVVIKPVRE